MSFDSDPLRCTEPEAYDVVVSFTGNGAASPVKNYGKGLTVTWVSTGLYAITFTDNPGNLIGMVGGAGFQATTMSALKGYDATLGAMDATGKIVQVSITNSSFALADLQVLQTACVVLRFKRAAAAV